MTLASGLSVSVVPLFLDEDDDFDEPETFNNVIFFDISSIQPCMSPIYGSGCILVSSSLEYFTKIKIDVLMDSIRHAQSVSSIGYYFKN